MSLPDPTPGPDSAPGPDGAPGPRSFESALQQLEESVRQLDRGDLPLEQALRLFEGGVQLVRECQELLDKAERRIVELTEASGAVVERPFLGRDGEGG